jgi:uncharacterized membrane protein YhaH (DUF805 family)
LDYFIGPLKKYAEFTGRTRRKDYWMFFLIYTILIILLSVIDTVLGLGFLSLIFSLGMLVPSISIAARRLHDTGRSGWWQLISFIPLIGIIILLVFLVQDSHDDNDYGTNPKSDESA